MANYTYIKVKILGGSKETRMQSFEPILENCVIKTLDDRWKVKLADFEDEGPTWIVYLPGTAVLESKASRLSFVPGQDVGFPVSMRPRDLSFRHSPNFFERWAQGRVEEELSDHYGRGIYSDAINRTSRVGMKEFRVGKTFLDYLSRNFKKPISYDDQKYLEKFKEHAPEGHWG